MNGTSPHRISIFELEFFFDLRAALTAPAVPSNIF